ncbi:MAG TPA: fibronectin type III domain-containing protein, partial [Chitinophagaceae bacterium]|nr:fibronectin type III domain-containing protein [Chitinophagaceae bacterium]
MNSLVNTTPPAFVKPPSALTLNGSSVELPSPSSTVSISWTDNSDNEENFILERSADGVTFIEIAQPAANATSYSDANLSPNTKYYYRIKAVTASESSAYSAVASLTTPPIPTAPEEASSPYPANDFPYADPVSGALSLKWAGSSNTAKYEVFLGTSESNLVRQGEIAYSANPAYTLSGLSNGTTYFWRIDASNDKGTTQGQIWKFKTVSAIPDELVGYWAFDETSEDGTKITDSTDYDNHGVLGLDDDNQSIRVTGKVKNALDFATASTNMYVVSIPDKEQLYLDKRSFSISFWMKADAALLPQDNSTSAYLLCKGSITKNATTGATGKRFDIEFKNKQIRFAIDDD